MRKTVKEILRVPLYEREHFDWIRDATDDELDEYILGVSGNEAMHRTAVSERQKRHFKHLSRPVEPHWTVLPSFKILKWTFFLTIAVLIVSVAILAVSVLNWLFPKTPPIPNDRPAISMTNFVLAPTNLPPAKAAIQQASSPAIYTTLHTNILGR